MKKFALKMAFGSAALLALVACSESDDANISTNIEELIAEKEISFDIDWTLQAETYDSLPTCSSNHSGDVAIVLDDREAYTCSGGEWKFVRDILESVEKEDDLPECFPKNDGDIIWVKDASKAFKCDRRSWNEIEISSSSSEEDDDDDNGRKVEEEEEDELPLCSKRREGKEWFVESENKTYLCSEGEWQELNEEEESSSSESENDSDDPIASDSESSSSMDIIIIGPDSSDSEESSSSEELSDPDVSSSSIGSSSSANLSSAAGSSSSISIVTVSAYADMWSGWASEYSVNTGIDAGAENNGRWFEYNDAADGGNSTIEWPVARGNEYDAGAFDPIIDYCGGICGEYKLNEGFDYPFVGIGFNIAGSKTSTTAPEPADVSSWEGICVVYVLDHPGHLEMGFTDSLETAMEYDVHSITLPKKTTGYVANFKWEDFQQAGWGEGVVMSGDDAAKELVSLKFKISGRSGDVGSFNVMAVGRYNTCEIR